MSFKVFQLNFYDNFFYMLILFVQEGKNKFKF